MNNLSSTLAHFQELINNLIQNGPQEPNLVIGGSVALTLHGLNFRESTDVDIIIYSPTEKQKLIFQTLLATSDIIVSYRTRNQERKAVKIQKEESPTKLFTLDIIIEEDQETPQNLLTTTVYGIQYKVQSINRIIKAKASYEYHNDQGERYVREKDLRDLMNLKNDNFNLNRKGQGLFAQGPSIGTLKEEDQI